jgi:hypothetical protein
MFKMEFMMKNQAYYDAEAGVMREKYIGDALIQEAPEHYERVAKLFEGKPHRCTIIDLSETKNIMLNRKTRTMIAECVQRVQYDKIAFIGVTPLLRMLAKAMRIKGNIAAPLEFFRTEADALTWLKEDAKR